MCRSAAVVCASLLYALPAAAQEPPSVGDAADRPGFADSPVLVGRGHMLFETGFTLEHEGDDRASVRTFTWPQVELHGGVTSWLDLAVIWDGVVSARTRVDVAGRELEDTTTGLDDFRLGVKVRLVHRPHFDSALIGYVNVPVGSAVISRRYAEPFTRFAWSVPLTERVGVAGTVDLKGVKEDDDHVRAKPAGSAALSSALTDSLSGFVGHRHRGARLRLTAERLVGRSRPGARHRREASDRHLDRPPHRRRPRRLVHQRRVHSAAAIGRRGFRAQSSENLSRESGQRPADSQTSELSRRLFALSCPSCPCALRAYFLFPTSAFAAARRSAWAVIRR